MRKQKCLVRWRGYDASHDQWLQRSQITPNALIAYENFLRVQAGVSGRQLDNVPADATRQLETFVGKDGRCSAIRAQEIAEKAKATRELNRQAAAASSAAAPTSPGATPQVSRRGRTLKKVQPFRST